MALVNSTASTNASAATSVASSALSVTGGNAIAVAISTYANNSVVSTVTDTAGNTYTAALTRYDQYGGSLEIWTAKNVVGNASNVVTATFTASIANRQNIVVAQYSGRDTGTLVDKTGNGIATNTTSAATASMSPSQTGDDVFAAYTSQGGDSAWVAGTGYTIIQNVGSTTIGMNQAGISTAALTASISWTTATSAILGAVLLNPVLTPPVADLGIGTTTSGGASGSSVITLQNTTVGSGLIGGLCNTTATVVPANANTTYDRSDSDATVAAYGAAFHFTNPDSGGSVGFGGSTTTGLTISEAAIEILGWNIPTRGDEPVYFSRFASRFPQMFTEFRPTLPIAQVSVPVIWPVQNSLPDRRMMQARIQEVWGFMPLTLVTPVVVPVIPVPPMAPERFARPAWRPDYTQVVVSTGQGPTTPYAVLNGPAAVEVNEEFYLQIGVQNPTNFVHQIVAVRTYFVDPQTPGSIGTVETPAFSIPLHVWRPRIQGVITLLPNGNANYRVGVVLFAPGPSAIQTEIDFDDGTTLMSNPVTVTAVKVG